jgi:hypothetical protein
VNRACAATLGDDRARLRALLAEPSALGLLCLVALFWPGCQSFVNTMDDDEQRTHEPPRAARSEALAPYW